MSLVPSTVEPPPVAESPPPRAAGRSACLILCCYLLGAVAVTCRLWADPAGRMQVGDAHDVDQFAWFVRYAATAIGHGHLPALVTTALNAPQGVNLMWNTSFLLPGVLLAPVTLLAGPQVSLTLVLTLGFAGSAASLFWVLRRWGASLTAAALGGAVYGFSPALLNSGIGHYNFQFAVVPPLIIDALLRIVTGRGSAVRTGAWMGLLIAAQLFIGEEPLVDTAVAGLVLMVVVAAGHPRAVRDRAANAVPGLATGAALALLICGYPLWVQFHGPLVEHNVLQGQWSGNPAFFVDPSGDLLFHTSASAAVADSFHLGLPEVLAYLGWPLIAVLVAAAVWFWRDPMVRATAVTWVVLELLSLGGGNQVLHGFQYPGPLMPFHWLEHLPVLSQLLPNRFSILAAAAAAAALAFALDRWAAPRARAWRASALVAVLAVLPLVPLPYRVVPVTPVPAGWQAAFSRLRLAPDARVLVVPVPNILHTQAMRWQAETGEPGSMIGGYFLGPGRNGRPTFDASPAQGVYRYLYRLWEGRTIADRSSTARLRHYLAYWRLAAAVAITGRDSPLGRALAGLLGRPAFQVGSVLAWRL